MIAPEMIDAMVKAGLSGEQIAALWKADQEAERRLEEQARPRSGAERQRDYRRRRAAQKTQDADQGRDAGDADDAARDGGDADASAPPKEKVPPNPPKEKYISPPCPPGPEALELRRRIWRLAGRDQRMIDRLERQGSVEGLAEIKGWIAAGWEADAIADKAEATLIRAESQGRRIKSLWAYLRAALKDPPPGGAENPEWRENEDRRVRDRLEALRHSGVWPEHLWGPRPDMRA